MRLCLADKLAIVWAVFLILFLFFFVFAGDRANFFDLQIVVALAELVGVPWAFLRLVGWLFAGGRHGAA